MRLYSTNNPKVTYSLKEAILQGLPADNGLFMPLDIPRLANRFIDNLDQLSFTEIALELSRSYLQDDLDEDSIVTLVEDVFDFEVPLVPVTDDIYCLELFHGPTLAFKDFGARFMAQLISRLLQEADEKPCILVATSGDTGSAVAQGFYKVPGIDVVILYPKGKVSEIQEKQLTTIGANVTALEIAGTFDDCQRMVKQAFLDSELRKKRNLTSANSINIARLIPQSFYYFQVFARLKHLQKPVVCSVPSGNFGNLMGGLLAKRMGLPIWKFVAANNDNRVFFDYLSSGEFQPRPSIETISNAMDVGYPSNFSRIKDLYANSLDSLKEDVIGFTYSDEQTRKTIYQVYLDTGYILDPHGAIGYMGLREFMNSQNGLVGAFLGTAHPAKFLDVVHPLVSGRVEIPSRLQQVLERPKHAVELSSDYPEFKQYLLSN